ncbi:MAG: hypothetical protein HRU09_15305 [Oligoflexales bacterium]|nr:hypothetical protein [Oligoflexales bacterium]
MDIPSTSLMASSAATGASVALLMSIVAMGDLFYYSEELASKNNYRAFYADTGWYKEFVKLSPEDKKIAIEKNVLLLKQQLKDQKINLVITYIGGGSGHRTAKDSITNILNGIPGGNTIFNVVDYSIDTPFQKWIDKYWEGLMRKGDGRGLKKLITGQDWNLDKKFLSNLFYDNLKHESTRIKQILHGQNPDFIVSVHNARSLGFQQALGKELNADMRLVPTDFDARHFFLGSRSTDGKVRVDLPADPKGTPLEKRLNRVGLRDYEVTGYAVRWPFLEQAEKLSSELHKNEMLAEIDDFFKKKGVGKNDFPVFLMLGGTGTSDEVLEKYIKHIAKNAGEFVVGDGKVKMFVANKPEQTEFLNNLLDRLNHQGIKIDRNKFELLPQGAVPPENVAKFMTRSVNIVKPGGATTAELVTTKGKAYFDMTLSNHLPWEKQHALWFEKNGWGRRVLDLDNETEFLKGFREVAKLQPEGFPKNHFHLDWLAQMLYSTSARINMGSNSRVDPEDIKKIQKSFAGDKFEWSAIANKRIQNLTNIPNGNKFFIKNLIRASAIGTAGAAVGVGAGVLIDKQLKKNKNKNNNSSVQKVEE